MGHVSSKIILSEAERVYNSLDIRNRGYITVMDLMLCHHGANKRKAKFLQKVLQHIYSESMTKEYKLSKEHFLELFVAKATSEKKMSNRAILCNRFTENFNHGAKKHRPTTHADTDLNSLWSYYADNGSVSANIIHHIRSVASDTTNKEAGMLSQFGLNSRSSLHVIYKPEFFTETVTKQFATGDDLSRIIDYLSAAGIDVGLTLGSSFRDMIHPSESGCEQGFEEATDKEKGEDKEKKEHHVASLVMREYDYTNTGYLNEHEFSHFIQAIRREVEAHQIFLGTNIRYIGQYITGKTLGFGRGGIVKIAIHKSFLTTDKIRRFSSTRKGTLGPETGMVVNKSYTSAKNLSPYMPTKGASMVEAELWPRSKTKSGRKQNNRKSDASTHSCAKLSVDNILDMPSMTLDVERTQSDAVSTNLQMPAISTSEFATTQPIQQINQDDMLASAQVALKLIPSKPVSSLLSTLAPTVMRKRTGTRKTKAVSSDAKIETDGSSTECKDSSTNFDTSREAVPCSEPVALERLTGHQNIVELMDKFVYVDTKSNKWTAMALTLCGGGSLKEYRANTVVTEPMARYFFSQIMSAVLYMHLHGVAHMDLRLENCLLDNNGCVRICDFGNAMSFSIDEESKQVVDTVRRGMVAGTLAHMPPEMLLLQSDYSATKVDIWCCGLILYELLTAKPAFNVVKPMDGNHSDTELSKKLCSNICNMNYEALGFNYSAEARDLCSRMMSYDALERPDAYEILLHPWLQQEMIKPALAKGILILDPAPPVVTVQQHLEQLLSLENIEAKKPKDKKQNQQLIRLICSHKPTSVIFLISGETIHSSDKLNNDDIKLGYLYDILQSASGGTVAENEYIRRIQTHETVFKLTFYLKAGLIWEFQRLFRRIRYCMLNAFASTATDDKATTNSVTSSAVDDTPVCVRVDGRGGLVT
ncbi:Kinase [Giardia lamblia P15]|uniref:Kinase n=1 Tax=Giardia intestinalis (strain P15) TaxID=658858 RepID=E1F2B4_GIAIA|nr:Kinase [Giardia lamblia P15]